MPKINELICGLLRDAVNVSYGLKLENIHLEHPENGDFGDFASNVAMGLAKTLKQNPMEIAKKICYEIDVSSVVFRKDVKQFKIFESVEVAAPGFINFKLSKEWLYSVLFSIYDSEKLYGSYNFGNGERVALEHSNVNPNKAAHVGHLRNACIGQFIEKIYEFLGYDVEVQYYANDLGVQVVTSMMGVDKLTDIKPSDFPKYDHFAWEVYAKMESLINVDPLLQQEREDLLKKIEDSESKEHALQLAVSSKVLAEQLKTFAALDIDYDVIVHEKDIMFMHLWEQAFEKLKKNPSVYLATEGPSVGCWLVKMPTSSAVPQDGVEQDKIIVRSNGVPTYTGRDIAYHMWKYGLLDTDFHYKRVDLGTQTKELWTTTSEERKPDETVSFSKVNSVLDVIDGKQTYAIEAVKKSLQYLGYDTQAERMHHINYGFVYLSADTAKALGVPVEEDKDRYGMSGRKGIGVKIDDFIAKLDEKLMAQFGEFEALKDVRNGAIKFEMLKYNTFQDLVFDLEDSLNLKGYSGPYLQYTHARATSILEKANFQLNDDLHTYFMDNLNLTPYELGVLRIIYKYPEVVERAAVDFSPNSLCTYLYELSQAFNLFYSQCPILSNSDTGVKDFRLLLTSCVRDVLKSGLHLMGIKAPAKM